MGDPRSFLDPRAGGPAGGTGEGDDARLGAVLQDRYRVLARIASGGMGVIYRAERIHLGRPVAIKFLHPWIAAKPEFLRRFEIEARAMSRLEHPNCTSVIDFGVHEGAPYLVMDYVTGKTVRDALAGGRMSPVRAVHIIRQVLAGLAHAHKQGIVHRDIKPDNVILVEDADAPLGVHVRILDFGLAKLRLEGISGSGTGRGGTAASVTGPGIALGTPSYMAPEQALGGKLDGRADVYSVGVLLFELLTGRKPFSSDDMLEVLRLHREVPPAPIRTVLPEAGFSAALEAAVLKALSKYPADRFETASAFSAALASTPEGSQPLGTPAPTGAPPAQTVTSRARKVTAPTVAVAGGAGDGDGTLDDDEDAGPAGDLRSRARASLRGRARASLRGRARRYSDDEEDEQSPSLFVRLQRRRVWLMAVAPVLAVAAAVAGLRWLTREGPTPPAGSPKSPTAAAPPAVPPANPKTAQATQRPLPGDSVTVPPPARVAPVLAREEPVPSPAAPAPPNGHAPPAAPAAGPNVTAPAVADERPAPPPRDPELAQKLAEAERWIAEGRAARAAQVLLKLRRRHPSDPRVAYLLGNAYAERLWWNDALDAYRAAIRLDPSYRTNRTMIRHMALALIGDSFYRKAGSFLVSDIGIAARPMLEELAAQHKVPKVRQRAAALLARL